MLRRLGGILALLFLTVLPLVVPVRADDLDDQPVAPAPDESGPDEPGPDPAMPVAGEPVRNNIFGLNVARLMQERYIWAASDLVSANGGDWGYVTVVWTAEDRDDPRADLNLQVFLDRCYYFRDQPIICVATRFDPRSEDWIRPTPRPLSVRLHPRRPPRPWSHPSHPLPDRRQPPSRRRRDPEMPSRQGRGRPRLPNRAKIR